MALQKFPVMEIFGPTVQGEGSVIGQTSHFVRFGGCTYRCKWCDSMHAVEPDLVHENATRMDVNEITKSVEKLGAGRTARWITLSGGDPVLYDLWGLTQILKVMDLRIAVETQGAFYKTWLQECKLVTCSPKGPSSGMAEKTNLDTLGKYAEFLHNRHHDRMSLVFKIVIFTKEDLEFARHIHSRYPQVPMYLSCGTDRPALDEKTNPEEYSPDFVSTRIIRRFRWLVDEVLTVADLRDTTVLPQMHAMIWGHKLGV